MKFLNPLRNGVLTGLVAWSIASHEYITKGIGPLNSTIFAFPVAVTVSLYVYSSLKLINILVLYNLSIRKIFFYFFMLWILAITFAVIADLMLFFIVFPEDKLLILFLLLFAGIFSVFFEKYLESRIL